MAGSPAPLEAARIIGRYAIYDAIASGGMAKVHLGRLIAEGGFQRTVAIKRLHPHYAQDEEFGAMFLDEARLVSRIHHPNVVPTLDVVADDNELLLVMEYVRGESLSRLLRALTERSQHCPPDIAVAIVSQALHGLHAAHEAVDEEGRALELVHRDVSPQNVLVGVDGVTRVLDFGVAKAEGRITSTRDGNVKGKLLYMSPEQLSAEPLTRASDIYAVGVVLYEVLTGQKMFAGANEQASVKRIANNQIRLPSEVDRNLVLFDEIVRRATAADPSNRYVTAHEMSVALEHCVAPASAGAVGAFVQGLASAHLEARARLVQEIERATTTNSRAPELLTTGKLTPGVAVRLEALAQTAPELETKATSGVSRSLSSGPPSPPAAPRRRGRWALVLFPALAIVGAGTFMLGRNMERLQGDRTTPGEAPPAAERAAAPSAASPVPSASPPTVTATEPGVAERDAGAANPSANAAAKAAPPSRPNVGVQKPAAVNCDPPWTVDANGRRHFLPECLK